MRAVHDRGEKNVAKVIAHYVKNSAENLFIPLASRRLKDSGAVPMEGHRLAHLGDMIEVRED